MKTKLIRLLRRSKIKLGSTAAVILTLVILAGFCTSCAAAIYSFRIINTSDYSIYIPNEWTVKPSVIDSPKDSPNINIFSNGKRIGGIDILSYDSTKSIELLLGNHVSCKIKVDKIETSKLSAMKVIFERDWQVNEQRLVQYELHIYFMPGKLVSKYGQEIVYDLSLNSDEIDIQKNPEMKELNEEMAVKRIFDVAGIDENKLIKIVTSFTLKNSLGTSASN